MYNNLGLDIAAKRKSHEGNRIIVDQHHSQHHTRTLGSHYHTKETKIRLATIFIKPINWSKSIPADFYSHSD
jgi:hypothetical protein